MEISETDSGKKRWAGRPEGMPTAHLKKIKTTKNSPNHLTTRSIGERTRRRRQMEALKSWGMLRHFLTIIPDQ